MLDTPPFSSIAVIGAGTMGSAIAGQIANAGGTVLLLDLPAEGDTPNSRSLDAIERLLKSDPPALMDKNRTDNITCGNLRDDFDKLRDCDWIIEAVVERVHIKQSLYKQLDGVIAEDCVITSNTSTIPISVLMEGMPKAFQRRFAITHYFNPVRYMRLLELVKGAETAPDIIARLADYNDRFMGKGVVICRDTPGFLGNRVGVFALQVGLDEAYRHNLKIEDADALMGRPMGIPKTGIFGLYDLIGIDLMADVVATLENILPPDDAFFTVGKNNPLAPLMAQMIAEGFTGDKGKGGFYRTNADGGGEAINLIDGTSRNRDATLPPMAVVAAQMQADGGEPLEALLADGDTPQHHFIRAVLARVLGYAASLIPEITQSPQDIDDAMKLGFNWVRGPFEMIDAIGTARMHRLLDEAGIPIPPVLQSNKPFYQADGTRLTVRLHDGNSTNFQPIALPAGTIRFSLLRQCLNPIARNSSASLYTVGEDYRLVEFHSKANTLDTGSIEILEHACENHGRGIIIHNDAQHFSAGVNLNAFLAMIESADWYGIDAFLHRFQHAVLGLRQAPVPALATPSGLTLGGGFEVVVHADKIIAHANIVVGLVECGVGLVPSGGGVKESLRRWYDLTGDWRQSAWKTWMQVGYARTGSSPEACAKFRYFLPERDEAVMNRDKLLSAAMAEIEVLAEGYTVPEPPVFDLPDQSLLDEMAAFMDKGIADGVFFPHDKVTALAVGSIVVDDAGGSEGVSEEAMLARERRAFLRLAQTPATKARIASLLNTGTAIRN